MEENIEAMEVPEVETEVILIKQVSNEDVRVGEILSFLFLTFWDSLVMIKFSCALGCLT